MMPTVKITYEDRTMSGEWKPYTFASLPDAAEYAVAYMRERPDTYRNIHVAWSEPAAVTAPGAPVAVPAEILATLRTVLAVVRVYDATVAAADPFIGPDGGDYAVLLRLLAPLFELIGDAAPVAPAPSATDDV